MLPSAWRAGPRSADFFALFRAMATGSDVKRRLVDRGTAARTEEISQCNVAVAKFSNVCIARLGLRVTGVLTAISSCIAAEARRLHGFDADDKGAANGLDEVRAGAGGSGVSETTPQWLTRFQGRALERVA